MSDVTACELPAFATQKCSNNRSRSNNIVQAANPPSLESSQPGTSNDTIIANHMFYCSHNCMCCRIVFRRSAVRFCLPHIPQCCRCPSPCATLSLQQQIAYIYTHDLFPLRELEICPSRDRLPSEFCGEALEIVKDSTFSVVCDDITCREDPMEFSLVVCIYMC